MKKVSEKFIDTKAHRLSPISNRVLTHHQFELKERGDKLTYERSFAANVSIVVELENFDGKNMRGREWQVYKKFNGILIPMGVAVTLGELSKITEATVGVRLTKIYKKLAYTFK